MGKRKSSAETAKLGSDIRVGTPKNGAHTKPAKTGQTSSLISVRADTAEKLWYKVDTVCFGRSAKRAETLFAPDDTISITDICEQIKVFTLSVQFSDFSVGKAFRKIKFYGTLPV